MSAKFIELQRFRMMVTGARYSFVPPKAGHPVSESTLEKYVLALGIFFNERLSSDVTFLCRNKEYNSVHSFVFMITRLRTYYAHEISDEVVRFNSEWRGKYKTPLEALENLELSSEEALGAMSRSAFNVVGKPDLRDEWARIVEVEVETVMKSVAREMGLTFRPNKIAYMVRQVEGRLKNEKRNIPYSDFVAEICSQEIISQRLPLPVRYAEVLDFLGMLQGDGASGALLVAHSVASIAPQLTGAEFLERVEETWRAAASY